MLKRRTYQKPARQITLWLANGEPGSQIVYYTGPSLTAYREETVPQSDFDKACDLLWIAAENGRVHLLQKRLQDYRFDYIAVKSMGWRRR
jgi:NADPH-dependent ferric siderophore reductase